LRYLHLYGHVQKDYSALIPRVTSVENASVPMIWSENDISKLLQSVDQSSPVGKRNYAILILCTELGLRACDIDNLKLTDIDWSKKEINIVQEKTGVLNTCPLTNAAGWAVINYLRYGRPKSKEPYVFLTCNAPYRKLGPSTATTMLKQQMRLAGIKPSSKVSKTGIHSLRHSLARRLLDKDIPLELVSEIMGHTEIVSSSPYLKIDVAGLRMCALSLSKEAGND
jgi:integrase/recombinase XerD